MNRPEFLAKPPSKEAVRKEGKSSRGNFRPTTPEDIERGIALRRAQADMGPTETVKAHFIIGVEWLSATIEGEDILVTGRFDGYVHRTETTAEVLGTVATVRIPCQVTTYDIS